MSANSLNPSSVSGQSVSTSSKSCPCGSGVGIDSCCLPIIHGRKEPSTAEELLRARYTAFTRGEIDYILNSHHSRTRAEIKRDEVEDWSKNSMWLDLHIKQIEGGGPQDNQGVIIFCAQYEADGEAQEHWERALFEKEDGKWKFLDAQGIQTGPYRRQEPKIGRNDPCPCGSGKKFKKCCAVA